MPVTAENKPSLFAVFFNNSNTKHKTERVRINFWLFLTDTFTAQGWGNLQVSEVVHAKAQHHREFSVELTARVRVKVGIVNY